MVTSQPRKAKGQPTGGQFAETAKQAPQVVLTGSDADTARQLRETVATVAGTLTRGGAAAARERMGGMADADVSALRDRLRAALEDEVASTSTSEAALRRDDLIRVAGAITGRGTVEARRMVGHLTDDDVALTLTRLGDEWDAATGAPTMTDPTDPWGSVTPTTAPARPAAAGSVTDPATLDDIRNGDAFVLDDGTVFQRRREGVYADTPYAIAVRLNRPVTDAEMLHAGQLVGYAYAQTGGERAYGDPERVDGRTFVMPYDTTKGRAYRNLDKFEESLAEFMEDGSPVRKSDRSGPGTRGTRLVDGFGDDLGPEIFYDSVYDDRDTVPDVTRAAVS